MTARALAEERRDALYNIVAKMQPMTVRQVFYQATVLGVVEKTEQGYNTVKFDLVRMRRSDDMPYYWLVDNSRWVIKPRTFGSVREALEYTAERYRKALWDGLDCRVQIWVEKDALTGVISPVTAKYDVPLLPARGYSSLSFLYDAAQDIKRSEGRTHIYHFGDYDPSGVNAAEKIEETLRDLAPGADIVFKRAAVTPDQITEWNLPTRPTKRSDTRAAGFGSEVSVELDAIDPDTLRGLVERAIKRHLKPRLLKALMAEQECERKLITKVVRNL